MWLYGSLCVGSKCRSMRISWKEVYKLPREDNVRCLLTSNQSVTLPQNQQVQLQTPTSSRGPFIAVSPVYTTCCDQLTAINTVISPHWYWLKWLLFPKPTTKQPAARESPPRLQRNVTPLWSALCKWSALGARAATQRQNERVRAGTSAPVPIK